MSLMSRLLGADRFTARKPAAPPCAVVKALDRASAGLDRAIAMVERMPPAPRPVRLRRTAAEIAADIRERVATEGLERARAHEWDRYLMGFATHAASKSKDSTKVGAVLVGPAGEVRLTAFNGPPKGVLDLPARFERPAKYLYAAHAERNLIAFAAREGIKTDGCTVYCTHAPCSVCSQTMIQAGVKHVVHGAGAFVGMEAEVAASLEMFADVKGTVRLFVCEEA